MIFHKTFGTVAVCIAIAGAALAHSGVKNADVMARMKAMGAIAQNTKLLGNMSKGAVEFDATVARNAARIIARQAAKMPEMFKKRADDPKSEALPVIWTQFDDFTSKAEDLRLRADAAATQISTRKGLRTALANIGDACQSCHQSYRKQN